MWVTRSFTTDMTLLPLEDFSDKKTLLKKYAEEIANCDVEYFSLVDNIFIGEEQKGEIVDEMILKTKQLQTWNTNMMLDVNHRINQVVNRFQEQVDEMKQQELTVTYEVEIPEKANS